VVSLLLFVAAAKILFDSLSDILSAAQLGQ
jgi:hypothetical protein